MPTRSATSKQQTESGEQELRGIALPKNLRRLRKPIPAPLLGAGRQGVRQFGIATASRRATPTFLIIGTKKGGTTSLMNWLLGHPCVARPFPSMQRLKSPHYFDINYWRGPAWYRSHWPSHASLRRTEQRQGSKPALGEAAPYYMFHPAVPARVAATLPDVKLIILLRDPVTRAYSNYVDRCSAGAEDLPTFEDALAAELPRLAHCDTRRLETDPHYYNADHDNHTYLSRGRYVEHLPVWFELFPPDQMLVLQSESLFGDPAGTFEIVQRFLGIPVTDAVPLSRFNPATSRRPMQESTRRWLVDYYRPHNAALYDFLGRDLGWEASYPSASGTPANSNGSNEHPSRETGPAPVVAPPGVRFIPSQAGANQQHAPEAVDCPTNQFPVG